MGGQGIELQQGLESKVRQLAVLSEVTRSVTELIDLERLVPFVISKNKELLHADGSAVLLLDEKTQELFFPYTAEAGRDVDDRLASIRLPASSGIAGWVVRHGKADLVDNAPEDERWYPDVDRQTGMVTRSLLTAPLRTRHGVIGAIQVRSAKAHAFNLDDLGFLEALAEGIAVATENARLSSVRCSCWRGSAESLRCSRSSENRSRGSRDSRRRLRWRACLPR